MLSFSRRLGCVSSGKDQPSTRDIYMPVAFCFTLLLRHVSGPYVFIYNFQCYLRIDKTNFDFVQSVVILLLSYENSSRRI